MRLKLGAGSKAARPRGLKPEALLAIIICNEVVSGMNFELVITSITEGEHGPLSLHPTGEAFDFETRKMTKEHAVVCRDHCQKRLGPYYDVVFEKSHMHVEHDPK